MLIAVHGSYFAHNFGDTLLIKEVCHIIANRVGADKVVLACEGNTKEQQEIGYPVCKKKDRSKVTHLVFAGGGYFGEPISNVDEWSKRCKKRHLDWVKDYSHAKRFVCCVGFGPISDKLLREDILRLFEEAECVLVRDKESYNHLRNYGYEKDNVAVCVDLALLPIVKNRRRFENSKKIIKIGIHLPNTEIATKSMIIKTIIANFDGGDENYFLLRDSHSRNPFKNWAFRDEIALFSRKSKVTPIRITDINSFKKIISTLDLIVTDKLHVGIVGLAHGVKVIGVGKHPKIRRLYEQIGASRFYVNNIEDNFGDFTYALDALKDYSISVNQVLHADDLLESSINDFLS